MIAAPRGGGGGVSSAIAAAGGGGEGGAAGRGMGARWTVRMGPRANAATSISFIDVFRGR